MNMRTPLSKVRGLGSAHEGTDHFWWQRASALSNIVLTLFLVYSIVMHVGAGHSAVKAYLGSPVVAILMLMLIFSIVYHMRLGMQVIIEDYVHSSGLKVVCLMLNTFFTIFVGLACVYSILKISFGV